jgi:RNA polymerase sigma factor (sigma-70 family)
MAEHALMKRANQASHSRKVETEKAAQAAQFCEPKIPSDERGPASRVNLEECLRLLNDPQDQHILLMRLADASHLAIAKDTRVSVGAVRQRWSRIRAKLRRHFTDNKTNR